MASVNPVAEQTSVLHVARTTVAALSSLLLSRALHTPEPYWATISTIVVMQSSLGAAWKASRQRLAGTVLGALLGGMLASWVPSSFLAYAVGVLCSGLVCWILDLDRTAYRFAGITVAIIVLVERHTSAWVIAAHRFVEVSLGIAVALVLTAAWPEPLADEGATDTVPVEKQSRAS
jgi:uncharacterized membrane protein YccC